ncbi:MAG: putative Zn-dependent protease [Gammaproteobacteria bacterium]
MNLARLDLLEGKTREAEIGYRAILDDYPDHAVAGVELARLYLGKGDRRAAEDALDDVLKANPDRFDAR